MKKVGKITHYYDNIGVAIVELSGALKLGDMIRFQGHGADFEQPADSIQINHEQVKSAGKGDVVGLKVEKEVKEGTEVLKA
jgi:putative protease